MSQFQNRTSLFILLVFTGVWIMLGVFASDGLYNTDESLYRLGAESFRNNGNFVVQNGYDVFGSEDLRHVLLVNGPNGLVPQYPVGSALAAASLIDLFGQKSLIVLNVLASIGALFTTYALAKRLFGTSEVARLTIVILSFATFWSEYVVGQWPHSISLFFVSLAILLFLNAMDRARAAWHPAFWSGLCVGLGMSFRLEVLLLLPAIAAATILYARKPFGVIVAGTLGMVPTVALLAYSNQLRFGTYNPLSYGKSGGGTDAATYMPLGIGILVALAGLTFLRRQTRIQLERKHILAGVTLLSAAAIALSPIVPILNKLVVGIHAIFLDSTVIHDPRPGALVALPDGTVAFWGLPKKALVQSLPWLGCLAVLIGLVWGERRRSVTLILIFVAAWALPFVLRSWHGGMSSNMRYLLPMVPLLAMLAAWIILELWQKHTMANPYILSATAAFGFLAPLLFVVFANDSVFWLSQVASLYVFTGVAAFSFLAGFSSQTATPHVALHAVALGLGWSSYLAFQDYSLSQSQRAKSAAIATAVSSISDRAVLYGAPAHFFPAFRNPEQLLARPADPATLVDADFVKAACQSRYRILIADYMIGQLGPLKDSVSDYVWDNGVEGPAMVEFDCDA
ncbi:glycosyltransferase family 39 protein [Roseovarius phycicola]|uniref:Glycosyltransferase family 39 protein n=1 Tax=Roseovarius phycicola TaxID=3080976 RepID=A0ABZ2HLK3_9RHOB